MKNIIYLLIPALMLALVSFSGCERSVSKSIEIKNFQKSECLSTAQSISTLAADNFTANTITFVTQNSLLHVDLIEIMMSCCMEKINYEISIEKENIIINLIPINGENCNCLCSYNLNFDIDNLTFGSYIVQIQFDGLPMFNSVNLIYDSTTNQTNPLNF
jgi:hypothetical protein